MVNLTAGGKNAHWLKLLENNSSAEWEITGSRFKVHGCFIILCPHRRYK